VKPSRPQAPAQKQRGRPRNTDYEEDHAEAEVNAQQQGLGEERRSLSERYFGRAQVSAVRAIEAGEQVMRRGNEEVSVHVSHVFGSPQSDPERRPLHTDILFQPVGSVGAAMCTSTVAPRRLVVSSWQQISTAVVDLSNNVCFVEFASRGRRDSPTRG
jgi:hypothetical protein